MVFHGFPMVIRWLSFRFLGVVVWVSWKTFQRFYWGCPIVFIWFPDGTRMVFLLFFQSCPWGSCGCQIVPLWVSDGFHMVFQKLVYGSPIIVLWFSNTRPICFRWFSYDFPKLSYVFQMSSHQFSDGCPMVFQWLAFLRLSYGFRYVCLMVFLWLSYGFLKQIP